MTIAANEFVSPPLRVAEDDNRITVATGELVLLVDRDPFAIRVETADGTPVLGPPAADPAMGDDRAIDGEHGSNASFDPAARYLGLTYGVDGTVLGSYNGSGRQPRWYRPVSVLGWEADGDTLRIEAATNDIVGRVATIVVEFLDVSSFRLRMTLDRTVGITDVGWAASAEPDEGFFGLGERFARTNHRGFEVLNSIEDAYVDPRPGHDWTYWPVPFFVSNRGYGVFVDTTRQAAFRMGSEREDAWQVGVDGAELDAVVFVDPDPLEVVRRYTALTGRPPLPPVWTFGVWKTTLSGDAAVRDEARRLRDEGLGISAVWIYDQLELDTNSGWNSAMGYPEGEYPDLPGLVRDLHADGYKVLGYLNTQFIAGRPRTEEGIAKGYFLKRPNGETYIVPGPDPDPEVGIKFGALALYDPTHPEGVPWWQSMLRRMLTETGYDGWMHDFGEYTPRDAVFADGRTGEEIRNLYPTLYQRTGAEACREVKPDFAFFVRSGYVGSNQWAPGAWPGDQHTDWSWDRGLPSIIPAALSVGICGTNTWGPDIGGFFDAYDNSDVACSTELWIRWCQVGALTPIMRDHLGPKRMTTPGAIDMWSNAQTVDAWRRFARFHNALVPYLYAYAARAHETGLPTMRHMVLRYPGQPDALRQDHQYLLGDELLVAPVVEPGATTRRVWFPPGTWYGFWDDATRTGPGYQDVPAPIETIPLFVRAGSVVPLLTRPVVTLADAAPDDLLADLELRLYPDADGGPSAYGFAFHDGSAVRVVDEDGVVRVSLAGPVRDHALAIRFPRGFAPASATADAAPAAVAAAEGSMPWWDESGERAGRFGIAPATTEVVISRR